MRYAVDTNNRHNIIYLDKKIVAQMCYNAFCLGDEEFCMPAMWQGFRTKVRADTTQCHAHRGEETQLSR